MKKNFFIHSLNNSRGVALLMVLMAIALLTAVLADFTFETKLNKLRTHNNQDKIQAKLNAEAGLKFAMARLTFYQASTNLLEKNQSAKKTVKREMINKTWDFPPLFSLPLPAPPKSTKFLQSEIQKFNDESFIRGSFQVSIQNNSQLININRLRIPDKKSSSEEQEGSGQSGSTSQTQKDKDAEFSIDKQLEKLIKRELDIKRDRLENFDEIYGDKNPKVLVSALKHYVNRKDSFTDEYTSAIESSYQSNNRFPKYAPLSSISELNLVEGWDDEIIKLIADEVTVHGAAVIDLNKISRKGLQILLPDLEPEQLDEFFAYRDDPAEPVFFESLDDFKKYVVNQAKFITEEKFNNRITEFKKNNIEFGTLSTLFRVRSVGNYGRATYTIIADVEIPSKKPVKKDNEQKSTGQSSTQNQKKNQPKELLAPRIVEMQIL